MISEDAIVRTIFLDMALVFEAILFIALFAGNGFNGIGTFLEVGKDMSCSDINKKGANGVLVRRT